MDRRQLDPAGIALVFLLLLFFSWAAWGQQHLNPTNAPSPSQDECRVAVFDTVADEIAFVATANLCWDFSSLKWIFPHSDTTGQTTDDHHPQSHSIDGASHTGDLSHNALDEVTANQHHAPTVDTNAQTLCTGIGIFLDGEGNCSPAGGTPGGVDGEIQYNNSGAFAGGPFWDNTNIRLGIGTTTPERALHVRDTNPNVLIDSDTAGFAILRFRDPAQEWAAQKDFAGNWKIRDETAATEPFLVQPAAPTNSLLVASNGNVGIGVTPPTESLHVAGSALFRDAASVLTLHATASIPTITMTEDTGGTSFSLSNIFGDFQIIGSSSTPFSLDTDAPAGSLVMAASGRTTIADLEAPQVQPIAVHYPNTSKSGLAQFKLPLPGSRTISEVCASTDAGTVTIQLDERIRTKPNTPGVDILTAPLVATTTEACTASFTNAVIAKDDLVNLDIDAIASSPTMLRVHVRYQ